MPEELPMFETTHVLGAHIASSPLLAEAWRQSAAADTSGGASFVAREADGVVYVAFSRVPTLSLMASDPGGAGFFRAIPIAGSGGPEEQLFASLVGNGEEREPVLVHAASLHCFLAAYNTSEFQTLLTESQDKALVFTGCSAGGTVAALAALCFLCLSRSPASLSPASLLCITFGSPPLGNESFARTILKEGWGGKFCHVVTRGDVVPRLHFCPADSIAPEFIAHLLLARQPSATFPCSSIPGAPQQRDNITAAFRSFVSMHIRSLTIQQASSELAHQGILYRPFGSYLFCSAQGGAVCVDNSDAIMKMMYLTCAMEDSDVQEENCHCYGEITDRIYRRSLLRGSAIHEELRTPCHDAGIMLALEASGIKHHDMEAREAEECLRAVSRIERIPSLNCANLARKLAKVTPFRAQIEWYKTSCDEVMGYYDAFKRRGASKRAGQVNMNRRKLAQFWDGVLEMLERNQLPHDFCRWHKWVCASHFYKLLVEPLDIAEFYRNQKLKTVEHYLTHGRERRYRVFDQWWCEKEKRFGREGEGGKRSKYAGLTQDSCFWARVEEAREIAERARGERDPHILEVLWERMNAFDSYAKQLIERKEVSVDVLAEQSSYRLWEEEWGRLKSEFSH